MVTRFFALSLLLCAGDLLAQESVGGYRDDFVATDPLTPGWSYLWNAPEGWSPGDDGDWDTGPIGDPAGYRALQPTGSTWTPDGDTTGTNNSPAGFLRLSATGGHAGITVDGTNRRPRYAIVAFTVQSAGFYAIENSFIEKPSANGNGIEVLVFPGLSEAVLRTVVAPTQLTDFDVEIGHLAAGQTIYLAFGPDGDATFDGFNMDFEVVRYDRASLRDQIVNAISAGENAVTIAPGRYYSATSGPQVLVQNFSPANGFTINADGVELICQVPNRAFSFINCSNLVLRGITIDYDPVLFRQGTVVNRFGSTIDVRLHEGYPATLSSNATSGIAYDPSTLQMRALTNTLYPNSINEQESGLYRIDTSNLTSAVRFGDYVSFTEPGGIPHTIYFQNGQSLRFEDVQIHGSPAFAVLGRTGRDITLERVRVVPGAMPLRADVPRLLSSSADGLHFKSLDGEITINDCHLAYNGDDCIVLTASYGAIIGKAADNVLTIAYKSSFDFDPGDNLFIYDAQSGIRQASVLEAVTPSPLAETEIKDLLSLHFPDARVGNADFKVAYTLTLEDAVTATVGGVVANQNQDSSNFVISNCSINNTRARGILIKASNGVVEDNSITNSLLAGIQIRPDARLWMEADFARNVTIQNNFLTACAIGKSNAYAPLYVDANGFDNWQSGSGHVGISLLRNIIQGAPGSSIFVRYANDVVIRSNQFIDSHNLPAADPWYPSVIQLRKVNGVRLEGINRVMRINAANANMESLVGLGGFVRNLDASAGLHLDTDADLLPDDWEVQYIGDPLGADPDDDADGDGYTLLEEFVAGLDPKKQDRLAFRIEATRRLSWDPIENRFYTILSSTTLGAPFAVLARDLPATQRTFEDTEGLESEVTFYRLKVSE